MFKKEPDRPEGRSVEWTIGVCSSGCVHLSFGCAAIHLPKEIFLEVAKRIGEIRSELVGGEIRGPREALNIH